MAVGIVAVIWSQSGALAGYEGGYVHVMRGDK